LCAGTYYRERLIDRWAAENSAAPHFAPQPVRRCFVRRNHFLRWAVIEAALNFSRGWNIPEVQSELPGAKVGGGRVGSLKFRRQQHGRIERNRRRAERHGYRQHQRAARATCQLPHERTFDRAKRFSGTQGIQHHKRRGRPYGICG